MGLLMSRPEKADEMTRLVHAIRETAVAPARNGELNLTEVINCHGRIPRAGPRVLSAVG